MNVLVIGGSYFVGRAIVRGFLADHHNVTVLNRGTRRVEGTEQLVADRGVSEQMMMALAGHSFDLVVDTSCYTVEQCQIVWSALNGRFDHWMHLSTAAVYVEDGSVPLSESRPTGRSRLWGDYGFCKAQADDFLLGQAREYGLAVTIIRPPYIYGPGNAHERERFFWSRLLRGRPVLVPDGQSVVQFIHVEDLYGFIRLASSQRDKCSGQVFNVGNPTAMTFKSLVELLATLAGTEANIVPVPYRFIGAKVRDFFPFRDCDCVLDVGKAIHELSWVPKYEYQTGYTDAFSSYDPSWLASRPIETAAEDSILMELKKSCGSTWS
ncbi:MAG: NAD-dependent epimerase/dehydratase family protein [Dehalococcoidia bacterium]|nr:NAD-dependent epimerase/dehydratase family protein [Dehalococcoidia bacterium]